MSSVSAVGSNSYYSLNTQNGIGNAFQELAKALKSGDLSSAQTAFATLQSDLQKIGGTQQASQSTTAATTATTTNSSSTLQNDMNALASALQSGNLSDAQKAFATLQTDAQNQVQQGQGHHHHHHHHQVSTDQSTTGTTTASPDSSSTGTSVNLLA
jgi:ribosomal protein S20